MTETKPNPPFKLPVRPLENPLNDGDLAKLQELEHRLEVARDMCARASGLVQGIEERIERTEMHIAVHRELMNRYFPQQLPAAE